MKRTVVELTASACTFPGGTVGTVQCGKKDCPRKWNCLGNDFVNNYTAADVYSA